MNDTVRYGDWAPDRQGWFLGLSGPQWIAVVASAAPGLLGVGSQRWAFVLAWVPLWALLVALIVVPVRGRPAARWLLDTFWRAVGGVLGWTSFQSKAAAGRVDDVAEADLPGVLAGIRTHDGPPTGVLLDRPAVIQDRANQTWAAVARVSHPGIGLAEAGTRARLGAGLAELLEAAASAELISTVAIQVRTVPDDGAERAAWTRRNLNREAPQLALDVTAELGEVMTQAGVRHESFVTVVVPEQRIARQAKEAGGGVEGRARVLYGAMAEVETRLVGAMACTSVEWLSSPALAAAIRTGFAPGDRAGLTAATIDSADDPAVAASLPMAAAGPSSAPSPDRRWYTHDAWSTVTCTVVLPDQGAVMGALAPLFAPTEAGERRSVTVFFEPMSRQQADRVVGRESMSAGTAAELRERLGFRTRAAHRRDAARVEGQDVRLAEGKALVRVAVAAAVTVPSTWPIAEYGRRLESSIRAAGFVPLRLDLAQDSGFAAACVPLGIGLPQRRGVR